MADRQGLRIIGFIVASVTAAVMLIAVVLVHKTVAGELAFDTPRAAISYTHEPDVPIPASGSPTGFTVRHTGSRPTARGFSTVRLSFAPRHSSLGQLLSSRRG